MQHGIDIEAWKRDGERLWSAIQRDKLVVIWWNNPWFRMAAIGALILLVAVVSWFVWRNAYVSVPALIIASPFIFSAAKYFVIGKRTGGLYLFFSENGFGVGCDADRIMIPYSEIKLPASAAPSTVNENYIVLPVVKEPSGIIVELKDGEDHKWDGSPYCRGIVTLAHEGDTLVAKAYPNEMLVHMFCAVYPLAVHLSRIPAEQDADDQSPPAVVD